MGNLPINVRRKQMYDDCKYLNDKGDLMTDSFFLWVTGGRAMLKRKSDGYYFSVEAGRVIG